jgi:uncharacterized membrane protein YgcG
VPLAGITFAPAATIGRNHCVLVRAALEDGDACVQMVLTCWQRHSVTHQLLKLCGFILAVVFNAARFCLFLFTIVGYCQCMVSVMTMHATMSQHIDQVCWVRLAMPMVDGPFVPVPATRGSYCSLSLCASGLRLALLAGAAQPDVGGGSGGDGGGGGGGGGGGAAAGEMRVRYMPCTSAL